MIKGAFSITPYEQVSLGVQIDFWFSADGRDESSPPFSQIQGGFMNFFLLNARFIWSEKKHHKIERPVTQP
jgi:hypothetical protein